MSVDGRLTLRIAPATGTADPAKYPYRVDIYGADSQIEINLPASWHPRVVGAECESSGLRRLDTLLVELGDRGTGQIYMLHFGQHNSDPDAFGGFKWAPVSADVPVTKVQCVPALGASYMESLLSFYDDEIQEEYEDSRWTRPYANFRPATADEDAGHRETLARRRHKAKCAPSDPKG